MVDYNKDPVNLAEENSLDKLTSMDSAEIPPSLDDASSIMLVPRQGDPYDKLNILHLPAIPSKRAGIKGKLPFQPSVEVVERLSNLMIKMLEFEYLEANGGLEDQVPSPFDSVIQSLQSLSQKPSTNSSLDNLEANIRSLVEWRMEKIRVLTECAEQGGILQNPVSTQQNLNNLELQDLKSENTHLWEKIDAQQIELKHLKTCDGVKDRAMEQMSYQIKVLQAQKRVYELKIRRLNQRTGVFWTRQPSDDRADQDTAGSKEK